MPTTGTHKADFPVGVDAAAPFVVGGSNRMPINSNNKSTHRQQTIEADETDFQLVLIKLLPLLSVARSK